MLGLERWKREREGVHCFLQEDKKIRLFLGEDIAIIIKTTILFKTTVSQKREQGSKHYEGIFSLCSYKNTITMVYYYFHFTYVETELQRD